MADEHKTSNNWEEYLVLMSVSVSGLLGNVDDQPERASVGEMR